MKIGMNSMQNPRNPQNTKYISGYAPGDHAGTAESWITEWYLRGKKVIYQYKISFIMTEWSYYDINMMER